MKSLASISQGFDKCTKVTLQNNYFWGKPPDDCFFLEIWSQYHYNWKGWKFRTILIWRRSRKMNRNKNLLILFIYGKRFQVYQWTEKKFPMLFLFNFILQQILNFLLIFHFVKLREGYIVKFYFQSISWNTVSGWFHETWNTFMGSAKWRVTVSGELRFMTSYMES